LASPSLAADKQVLTRKVRALPYRAVSWCLNMKRLPQLDALRAVAVLLVLGCHLTAYPAWVRFGWTGVNLFFVLSGFLISGLLFRDYKDTGTLHLKRFLIRRGFKIYPAYYLLLALTVAGFYLGGRAHRAAWHGIVMPAEWDHLWPDLLFLQNHWQGTWSHFWSLGVEEQFYVFLPASLYLLARKTGSFRWVPVLAGVVMLACLALRALDVYTGRVHKMVGCWDFDALYFGVLLSYIREFYPERLTAFLRENGRLLPPLSVLCLMPALLFEQHRPFMLVFGVTALYLGYGGLLLYTVSLVRHDSWLVRGLSGIGNYSYSIYLYHRPIAWFSAVVLYERLHWERNLIFALYLVASVAIGVGMARMIECPALRLRERLFPAAGNPA